jgi:hypothetical protein
MKETARHCHNCGRNIYGRSDKKFCTDACRNTRNNLLMQKISPSIRLINNILKNNRRVLQDAIPKGYKTRRITRAELETGGFIFGYFTSAYNQENGTTLFFCYDYGYSCTKSDDRYYIIKRKATFKQLPILQKLATV